MFSILKTTLSNVPKIIQSQLNLQSSTRIANYSFFRQQPFLNNSMTNRLMPSTSKLLRPQNYNIFPSCGFKVMGLVRRRCKDCYMVRRQERLYNLCKTHRRHKQMSMVKDKRNTWILSHATQSKVRPW